MTADPLVRAFERHEERRNLSKRTIANRRRLLYRYLRWLQPTTAADATRDEIEAWFDSCDIGPRARAVYLSTLRAFYRFAFDEELVPADPTAKIQTPRAGRLLPHPIAEADLAMAILGAEPRMRAWLHLAAYQGFRCAEIAGLRREDIRDDQEPPLLIVHQGKGAKDAVLPLNRNTEAALRVYGLPTSGYVFRLSNGRGLSAGTVSAYMGRYLHGLGIAASAHALRHYFVTKVYESSGHDIRLTQEMARHADLKTTSIYAQYDQARAAEVVRDLGGPARAPQPQLFDVTAAG